MDAETRALVRDRRLEAAAEEEEQQQQPVYKLIEQRVELVPATVDLDHEASYAEPAFRGRPGEVRSLCALDARSSLG